MPGTLGVTESDVVPLGDVDTSSADNLFLGDTDGADPPARAVSCFGGQSENTSATGADAKGCHNR
jgi:hypothetical protein